MKKMMLLIGMSLVVMTGWTQVVELDLQKCRKMALENSEKIKAAEQQGLKAGYDKKAVRANFLPKISATGLYAYVQQKMNYKIDGGYLPVVDANAQGVPDLTSNIKAMGAGGIPIYNQYAFLPDIDLELGIQNAYTVGVMLEQPLYMGGKVRSAFRMASIGKEMAEWNIKYSRSEVLTEAEEAYWQYVRVKEQAKATEKYQEVVTELVRNLEDACQTGMASQNDLLKAQVKQNEAELMLQKARNGLALSGMNLCRVVGIALNTSIEVNDSLQQGITPGLWVNGDEITGRPEYNLLEKQVELKEKQVALTQADFLPQLAVAATYGYGDGIKLNGEADGVATFAAVASLKIPIYNWGEGRNKVKAMKAEEEMTRLKKEETNRLMQLEVARARYNVEDADSRVKLTHKSLAQAEENLQVSKNRFEVGMETVTNYMEAQAQWQKAWSDWIDARTALRLSETYYLKATGRLGD